MSDEELEAKAWRIYSTIWHRPDHMIDITISEESCAEFVSTLFKDKGDNK